MKKIIIIRSNPVYPDPRVEKIIDALKDNFTIEVLAWDRECKTQSIEINNNIKIKRIHIKGNYGIGIKNFVNILKWFIFIFFYLIKENYDYIHACDFDTFLPSLLPVKIKRKKIIYDIFDFYADMIRNIPKFLRKIIKFIDKSLIRFANFVIIADEYRKEQIRYNSEKVIVINNTPPDLYKYFKDRIEESKKRDIFYLGYIGLLKEDRGIKNIIRIVNEINGIKLILGGYGDKDFENWLINITRNYEKIKYLGRVHPYLKTLEILSECDALFALYDPKIPNNRYASPNKLYEAMMLGKPIIVSKSTIMENIVNKFNIGFSVEYYNLNEIKNTILFLINYKKNNEINKFEKNCRYAYENFYSYELMKKRLLNIYLKL